MTPDEYTDQLVAQAPPLAPWQREVIAAALTGSEAADPGAAA